VINVFIFDEDVKNREKLLKYFLTNIKSRINYTFCRIKIHLAINISDLKSKIIRFTPHYILISGVRCNRMHALEEVVFCNYGGITIDILRIDLSQTNPTLV